MHHTYLAIPSENLPLPADPDRAEAGRERWLEAAARETDRALAARMEGLAAAGPGRRLLDSLFGNSPFLADCALGDPGFLVELAEKGPDALWTRLATEGTPATFTALNSNEVMATLRRARRRVALLVAVADIGGLWPLARVTQTLSAFAEMALNAALAHILAKAYREKQLVPANRDDPLKGCGYAVIGMGKLGACELNYSSDIDLIILYDEERVCYSGSRSLAEVMQRITRELIRMLEERTADGYVFRTDLRLRPDPGSTPPALSLAAAEAYYESMGQNWERAAMVKARAVAGDMVLGNAFLAGLRPFIWRKYLDFAALQDIHSIKRQIARHRGGSDIGFPGHNIKLGRGGIREIEFFAQTQQLIWGGRDPSLRVPSTEGALRALLAAGHVAETVAQDLIAAYRRLRTVEHRLQMIDDQQTQTLPEDPKKLAELATFLGYTDSESFARDLGETLATVARHYDDLFSEAPPLGEPGNLVFTGGDPDPDTVRTLAGMGYVDTEAVWQTIRSWHHGRYRATRSDRARQILTEIMPTLLMALSRTANPDVAFLKFDEFLRGLPAGVQVFSLLHSNPQLLDLMAEIMGTAPRLAERLARHPILLDAVLGTDFADRVPEDGELATSLKTALSAARDFQDTLDIVRRWTNDRHFLIGVRILKNEIDAYAAGPLLSSVAGVVIRALLPIVAEDFARQHGRFRDADFVVVAFGKLGGQELSLGSDLDLVFVYEAPEGDVRSDGMKPLPPNTYFTRLAQRFINALTTLTGEGGLFQVDMRLRPSGNAGPIVSSLAAFRRYYDEDAWTWEKMALTKARVVAGGEALRQKLGRVIEAVLTAKRDERRLAADVFDMRERIVAEHPGESIWNVKYMRGGLVDTEFVAQFLQLKHAHAHPEVLAPNTCQAFVRLKAAGCLDAETADELIAAERLWLRVQGMLRLCMEGGLFDEETAPEGLSRALARAGGHGGDLASLKARMEEAAARVSACFRDLIETPARSVLSSAEIETTHARRKS